MLDIEDKIIPRHLVIIPDGNRRWGKNNNVDTREAYAIGIRKIGDVLKWCKEADVRILTMWGFSTDNFRRERAEIDDLFTLFKDNLRKALDSDEKNKHDVRVRILGRIHLFPKEIQEMIKKAEDLSAKNSAYNLNLLLSYGGREEIVDAVNSIIKEGVKEVDEKAISSHLYTAELPDPDLIIRTSGEQRLSGLMPWQSAYSEFYFCDKLWPDFSREDFMAAIDEFSKRKRRYGK